MSQRLTMCLISLNEAENVKPCLDSFWDDVDHIVVGDTGSTDGTKEALEAYAKDRGGPRKLHLLDIEWRENFAEARQIVDDWAIEHTQPDWLSWCDMDDEIIGLDRLRREAEGVNPNVSALFCLYDYAVNEQGHVVCELWRERMVRAGMGEWLDPIHESQRMRGGQILKMPREVARWVHRKMPYQPSKRNQRILKKWLESEPDNWRVLTALAREYMVEREWKEAIPLYEHAYELPPPGADARSQMSRQLAVAQIQEGNTAYAKFLAVRELADNPCWPDTYVTLAEVACRSEWWREGLLHADQVLMLGVPDTVLIIDPDDYTLRAEALKAIAWGGMGNYEAAINQAEQVVARSPNYFNLDEALKNWRSEHQVMQTANQWADQADLLLTYDEPLKAREMLQTVPSYAREHPAVIAARARVHEALRIPYVVEHVPPDTARGQFLLAGIERQIAARAPDHDWEAEPLLILDPSVAVTEMLRGNLEHPDRVRIHPWPEDGAYYDAICFYGDLDNNLEPEKRLDHLTDNIAMGGLVYVGVRHGISDSGPTPGRKRSFQQLDVAALMRRHGSLEEFGVDEEGFISGVMTAAVRRGELAIFAGPALGPWHPMDIEEGDGLGGSETAAWRLAEGLSDRGYAVTLYGTFKQLGAVKDVILQDWRRFDPTVERRATIVFRNAQPFDFVIESAKNLLWLEDVAGAEHLTPERAERIDYICTVSGSHSEELRKSAPYVPEQKIITSRNGIILDFFNRNGDRPLREKRVLYTSSPDRGLDILLEVWPEVRKRVPDAELLHCYSRWWDHAAEKMPVLGQFRDRIVEMTAENEGVRKLPAQGQRDLAHLMQTALVWCLPSYCTPEGRKFNETNCISVQEAQAAGCLTVTGDWGALSEMNKAGVRIAGDPMGKEWRARFVDAIVAGLTDPKMQQTAQTDGPEAMQGHGWEPVVAQLESVIGG